MNGNPVIRVYALYSRHHFSPFSKNPPSHYYFYGFCDSVDALGANDGAATKSGRNDSLIVVAVGGL